MGSFAENLREIMTRKDMTAKDLGKITKISYRTIEGWLDSRRSTPRVTDAYNTARALGTTVEFLVTGERSAGWNPPERIAHVVADLELLDDPGLEAVTVLARGLASRIEHERRPASGGG